ncbi:MAG: CoA pyrophosphatase, partial [Magnetospirillum sp.]|nr:CoA pyrophosphatase [Magnetospirillum sp.]
MEQRHLLCAGTDGRSGLTRREIARRLAERSGEGRRSERRLAAAAGEEPWPEGATLDAPARPAAVLVPLVEREHALTVLLTRRTEHLYHHPGQVSFPGGRLEDSDGGDAVACALRETAEEIGLAAVHVTVLGRLDDLVTGTGFVITPVVAMVTPPFSLALDAFEVADVFEVPLDFVLDPANHGLHRREVAGRPRPFWALTWEERLIWGAPAGILVNLADVLGTPRSDVLGTPT